MMVDIGDVEPTAIKLGWGIGPDEKREQLEIHPGDGNKITFHRVEEVEDFIDVLCRQCQRVLKSSPRFPAWGEKDGAV